VVEFTNFPKIPYRREALNLDGYIVYITNARLNIMSFRKIYIYLFLNLKIQNH